MSIQSLLHEIEENPKAFPWSSEKETAEFLQSVVLLTHARMILEIGTYLGFTAIHLADALPADGRLYTIDRKDYFRQYRTRLPLPVRKKIQFIRADSQEALANLDPALLFDFIYLDGSHTFEHCFNDTLQCLRFTKQDTLLCFHDAMSLDYPGIAAVIRIFRFTNAVCFNCLFDILTTDTPVHSDGKSSGLAIIRIKYRSALLKRIVFYYWRCMRVFLNYFMA